MKNFIFFYVLFFLFFSCKEKKYQIKPVDQVSFKKLYDIDSTIQLVDVRTIQEFENGFIKGAVHIDYYKDDFIANANLLLNPQKPVYLYCKSGNRSSKAGIELLLSKKFTEVYYLKGGYTQWKYNLKTK